MSMPYKFFFLFVRSAEASCSPACPVPEKGVRQVEGRGTESGRQEGRKTKTWK